MTSEKFAQGVIRAAEHAALADLEQELAELVSASLAPREVNLDGVSDETLSKLVVTCTKIGAPVVVAKAEFQIKLRQMRKQEFEERARLEAVLQTQVNGLSPAESGAATITVNFEKHGSLPVAQRMFMNPNGIRVVVDGRAELLVEPGADTTGLGLRRLLDLIEWDSVNGDKAEQLKKLTHLLNPHLLEKFGEFMLDGQRGMPAGEDVHTSITVERDEAGAFRIHFDHRIGDVRTFTQPGGKEIQIAPGTQSAQLSFEVALGNDGGDPLVVENTIKCEIE